MVLASLPPLRLTQSRLGLTVIACLVSASCFAQTMLFPVNSTPYDHQMRRISRVLNSEARPKSQRTSLLSLNSWISRLRALPYQYSEKWTTPHELTLAGAGDCKGKALALYEELRANGAHHVRLVIGKRRFEDMRTHAWLEWETMQGTYLLDPTFNWTALRTTEQSPMTYIPFYAYDDAHKYRAFDPALLRPPGSLSAQVASHE